MKHSLTLKPPLNNAYNECANGESLFIAGHVQGHVLKITTESTALETGEPLNLQVLNPEPAEYIRSAECSPCGFAPLV